MRRIFETRNDIAPTIARLALGLVMLPHGAQKALGLFGGYGFSATMTSFTTKMGIPAALAFLVIVAEFLGSLGLITGLLTRFAAFGIGMTMLVAAVMVHSANGFFMNWFGNQKGEGLEYFILALGLATVLIIKGAGAFSLDGLISKQLAEPKQIGAPKLAHG